MRITIPDVLYEEIAAHGKPRGRSMDTEIVERLKLVADLKPNERVLVVRGGDLAHIEDLTHRAVDSSRALAEAVAALASINFGEVTIHLSPGQLSEIATRAEKNGKPIEQQVNEMAQEIALGLMEALAY